ncbi:class I SAM-dependent methyltransferase [Teredinibacter sp. KSP-S5-2]|uniref:class I SAM-dependent methyltransferase n=1 Tax=Teredinibacter sp. KSP-S5-2 TaxID=3034506 RepID=UPI0029348885|nr:class I SAM-dependent methyltransferase [Teredinibacter sp. KSP-S5-2]WNO07757.1 class I SAM-dependent methyltransferase [Teredinibacter sp. KSP-S5-2]
MYDFLNKINQKPKVFEFYTAESLWADEYRSEQMLQYHLHESLDISSRNHQFIESSSAWIIQNFSLAEGKKVCDFGCGPGLYTLKFAQAGADVTGVDFSRNSIEYARQQAGEHGLNIRYFQQNYLTFTSDDQFDLITMIMCDFCALSPEQRKALLSIFNSSLKPGGKVLLDVYTLAAFDAKDECAVCERNQLNHFWAKEDYFAFLNTFKYEEDKVILDKYTICNQNGDVDQVYNWLQYYSAECLTREFTNAGFTVSAMYSDVSGTPFQDGRNEMAIVAEKPNHG